MVKLAVFLGNPGRSARHTRHNLAWRLADCLSFVDDVFWRQKFKGQWGQLPGQRPLFLLKPLQFMNNSGFSVAAAAGFFKFEPEEILVVHDDMETVFGHFRHQTGGGLAGHNGLRSIKKTLGSDNFQRLRLGIGRPRRGEASDYVLGRFDPIEEAELPAFLERAANFFNRFIG